MENGTTMSATTTQVASYKRGQYSVQAVHKFLQLVSHRFSTVDCSFVNRVDHLSTGSSIWKFTYVCEMYAVYSRQYIYCLHATSATENACSLAGIPENSKNSSILSKV